MLALGTPHETGFLLNLLSLGRVGESKHAAEILFPQPARRGRRVDPAVEIWGGKAILPLTTQHVLFLPLPGARRLPDR